MIKDILEDIKLASKNKAYFSALALTLTIPDICGKIEYKNLNDKEKYIKWFNDWVYKYVEIPKGKDELFNKFDELAIFNGEVCYALRCAYLHSGNYELKECGKGRIKISRFELCVSDCECISGNAHGCSISNDNIYVISKEHDFYLKRGFEFIEGLEYMISDNCQICKEYNKTCFPKVMILKKKQNTDYRSEI